jgi:hypothetical protein
MVEASTLQTKADELAGILKVDGRNEHLWALNKSLDRNDADHLMLILLASLIGGPSQCPTSLRPAMCETLPKQQVQFPGMVAGAA